MWQLLVGEVISCTKKWFLTFLCCACVFVTAQMSIFDKHGKRKCRSKCTSILWAHDQALVSHMQPVKRQKSE